MKTNKFFKVLMIIGILMIALAVTNKIYAVDDDYSSDFGDDVLDLTGGSTTTTTTTTTATTATTTTTTTTTSTTTKATTTTTTTLPKTGLEDNTGTVVAIIALAVVGVVSFKVIEKNNDIK